MSNDTLERLVPDALSDTDATGHATLELHLQRYEFAAMHARPGRALDMACGVGYGSRLLADHARLEVLGVDLDPAAIAYATKRYADPRVRFECRDAQAFRDPDGFDTVVSLETIEHVPDPARLIERLVAAVRPGGVLVASVPTTPSVDVNPHHLHDFTEKSFAALLAPHRLTELARMHQVQRYAPVAILRRREARTADLRPNLLAYYARHPRAAIKRAVATARYGFSNRYVTIAWRR
jgi:SAM-dependent methyltransferase